jgi:hypothetical protein
MSCEARVLVRGIEPREHLPRPDRVADVDAAVDHAAVDAEREVDLGLRLDGAGERDDLAGRALFDGNDAHRAHLRRRRLLRAAAPGEQHERDEGHESDGAERGRHWRSGSCHGVLIDQ